MLTQMLNSKISKYVSHGTNVSMELSPEEQKEMTTTLVNHDLLGANDVEAMKEVFLQFYGKISKNVSGEFVQTLGKFLNTKLLPIVENVRGEAFVNILSNKTAAYK